MKNKRKFPIGLISLFLALGAFTGASLLNKKDSKPVDATYTQTASEYYKGIDWDKTGADLKDDLYDLIKISTAGWSYDGLFTAYQTTDTRPNGTVWDIYSDKTTYTHSSSHNYSKEGDGFNREHMIPQSIFSENAPMKSDIHHVFPSDGYVNNRRSNYPHGNVNKSTTYTSNDGYKLGYTNDGNYSGLVFEPKDIYKGDIARTYFYFVVCYQNRLSGFKAFDAFDKTTYPSIAEPFLSVYLQWAKDDPVSQKEIDRNNAAYAGQGNRNPFIDSPYAIGAIWDSSHASDYGVKGEYLDGSTSASVSISKTSASLTVGGTTTINATSSDSSTISWTTSNSSIVSLSSSSSSSGANITLTAVSSGTATITAKATIGGKNYSKTCTVTVSSASDPKVNSVTVSPSSLSLDLNGTTTGNLTANVDVSNGASQTVSWSSSNESVATVSSSGTVTAHKKGTATIKATSTFDNTKFGSCTVTVTDSSQGGGESGSQRVVSKSDSTYFESGSIYLSGNSDSASATCDAFTVTQAKNSGTNDVNTTYNEIRVYSNHSLMFEPNENYTITSVVITANNSSYASAIGGTSLTNCSKNVSSTTVTLTPTDGTSTLGFTNTAQSRINYLEVNYEYDSGEVAPTLSSISLDTTNVKKSYFVGDTFSYSGLVVTAHYSDSSSTTVTPTSVSSPDMTVVGNKTVTVSYTENTITKTDSFEITVSAQEVTAIYASVNTIYHPGDTISIDDISVEDNLGNEVTDFTFANDGYQFTYSDAPSGGNDGTKTFTNAISYSTLKADLTVTINRINYVTPSGSLNDTMNKTWTGVSGTSYVSWSGKTGTSGATYAGQSAAGNDSIQLRSKADNDSNYSGIVTTSYSGSSYITNVSVSWNNSTDNTRVLNIYGDTTPYTSPNQLYDNSIKGTLLGSISKSSGTSLKITGQYQYIGIKSSGGAIYLNEIVVSYGSGDTPNNVANYIMYEDTNNQCVSKFNIAMGYFANLSESQRLEFKDSEDYVIATARARLEAWAKALGKTIDYTNGVALNAINNTFINASIGNVGTIAIVIIMSVITFAGVSIIIIKRKKRNY